MLANETIQRCHAIVNDKTMKFPTKLRALRALASEQLTIEHRDLVLSYVEAAIVNTPIDL